MHVMTTQRNTYAESVMDRLLLVGDTIPVAIPQWRDSQLNHVQSMVEVLPEIAGPDGVNDVPVG
jgi:hypothetical protein